jgi:hypothetical protein
MMYRISYPLPVFSVFPITLCTIVLIILSHAVDGLAYFAMDVFHEGVAKDLRQIGAVLVALEANAVDINVAIVANRVIRWFNICVDIKLNLIVFNSNYITHGISPFYKLKIV